MRRFAGSFHLAFGLLFVAAACTSSGRDKAEAGGAANSPTPPAAGDEADAPDEKPEPGFHDTYMLAPDSGDDQDAPDGDDDPPQGIPASDFEIPGHAPVHGWSCLCFEEKGNEGPMMTTACRRSAAACGALQRRVEGGSPTLIRNSTPDGMGCRVIGDAKHPSALLKKGKQGEWQPSKKPGAFSYAGECLLEADASTTGDLQYALGPLSLGMPAAKVIELLGAPEKKGEIWEEAATGAWVQDWAYPKQGLELVMASSTEDGEQGLGSISAKAPCRLETPRGVAIGDPFDEVKRIYARFAAPKWEHGEDFFVAGSIYGGVIFHETASEHGEDIVETIFIGAAAE